MLISVDHALPTPVFEQIVEAVVEGVRRGDLVLGERLPTVRQLAADLGVAANTVAKAYRHLEEEGHVETRGRGGTVVSGELDELAPSRAALKAFIAAARASGLDLDRAIGLLRRSW